MKRGIRVGIVVHIDFLFLPLFCPSNIEPDKATWDALNAVAYNINSIFHFGQRTELSTNAFKLVFIS